jgi:hypothetical protein
MNNDVKNPSWKRLRMIDPVPRINDATQRAREIGLAGVTTSSISTLGGA